MTEFELLIDLHKDNERQGPGSTSETLKALGFIDIDSNKELKIADIGCGTGAQTISLVRNTNSVITAIDLFPEFLEKLRIRAKETGVRDKIKTIEASMEKLPFEHEEFDIIWSEGAIYNMGFEQGIKSWREYLRPGGYLAVSEITWTTGSRPKEIEKYWNREYPQIDTASEKINLLEANGYQPIGYFILSQKSWLDNYYRPIEESFPAFLQRNDNSEAARSIVEMEKEEIAIYEKYKDYYSYGFYIARKI